MVILMKKENAELISILEEISQISQRLAVKDKSYECIADASACMIELVLMNLFDES